MGVAEQRYLAVLAVIADGHDVTAAAQQWGVSRQTLHTWMGRYEADGLPGLVDRPHRPRSCPHQMSPPVAAVGGGRPGSAGSGARRWSCGRPT